MDRQTFVQGLCSGGYRLIGEGLFSEVYGQCDGDRGQVWKVSKRPSSEDGWYAWAQYVRHNGAKTPSPHFPRIWEVHDFGDWYAARMERLKPCDSAELDRLRDHVRGAIENKPWARGLPKSLKSVVNRIKFAFDGKYGFDLHQHNAMIREEPGKPPTLVITDPLSWSYVNKAA